MGSFLDYTVTVLVPVLVLGMMRHLVLKGAQKESRILTATHMSHGQHFLQEECIGII